MYPKIYVTLNRQTNFTYRIFDDLCHISQRKQVNYFNKIVIIICALPVAMHILMANNISKEVLQSTPPEKSFGISLLKKKKKSSRQRLNWFEFK